MHNTPALFKPSLVHQLVCDAAAYYAVLIQKLVHFPLIGRARKVASIGCTTLLLGISVGGAVQLSGFIGTAPTKDTAGIAPVSASAGATGQSNAQLIASQTTASQPAALTPSIPVRLQIPAINLDVSIVGSGLNDDGTLAVPDPGTSGWYNGSPSPGETGPSVIVGHLDSPSGPDVFYYLKNLQPKDQIKIIRQDNTTLSFTVERLATYAQDDFPTQEVYGNIGYPGLRLITCDGDFNYITGKYSHNLVVYAQLIQQQ